MILIDKKENILSGYDSYLKDESKLSFGDVVCLAMPENEGELTNFLKNNYKKNIPITISNGRTGVTGGSVPLRGCLLSVEKLNKIIGLEKKGDEYILKVQSGVSLAEIDNYLDNQLLEGKKYFYPVDVTETTAHIGGTISTNASGERSFKYGSTRKWVRYLKIAFSDGSILNVQRGEFSAKGYKAKLQFSDGIVKDIVLPKYRMPAVKNAAGYFSSQNMDIIDLFIGSEGTLGIILEAGIALVSRPANIVSIIAFFNTEKDAVEFSYSARKTLDSALVFEYFDRGAFELLSGKFPELPAGKEAAIFFEVASDSRNIDRIIEDIAKLLDNHGCSMNDTWTGFEKKDAEKIRSLRHAIPETINEILAERKNAFPDLHKISADIAVPENKFLELIAYYKESAEKHRLQYTMFGHIGENHLHMNILPKTPDEFRIAKDLHRDFAKRAVALGGTVSAEHGIGKIKHEYLEIMYGKTGIKEMAAVKKVFDPKRILNRGNIFPEYLLDDK